MKMVDGKQKGFTLIELLVVIAILGVIAAVVALNVAGFFGRGTLQAANTELHQAQTAIIACMADGETGLLTTPSGNTTAYWEGEETVVTIVTIDDTYDGADYVYGPFRASYRVNGYGEILWAYSNGEQGGTGQWGTGIIWDDSVRNWRLAEAADYP